MGQRRRFSVCGRRPSHPFPISSRWTFATGGCRREGCLSADHERRGDFKGLTYLDKIAGVEKVEDRDVITVRQLTDSVYYGMKGSVTLVDGDRSVNIRPDGDEWQDLAIWNPHGDEKMGYKNFVCIENAVAKTPTTVHAGEFWCSKVEIRPYVDGMPAWLQAVE